MTLNEPPTDDERDDSIGRLNALTDGVVAIAITLLALDLKPNLPGSASSRDLGHYLLEHAGDYRAFLISFLVIAQFWVIQRQRMRSVRRSNGALVRATLLFLFSITVVPWTSSINGEQTNALAVSLFAVNVALIAGSVGAIGEIIRRQHLDDDVETRRERVLRRGRSMTSVLIALLIAGMAWVIGDYANYLYLLYLIGDLPAALIWKARQPQG